MTSGGPIELIVGSSATKNWLLTTAIGGDYFERWHDGARPYWLEYAARHGLGVAVAVGDLVRTGEPALNGSWQKMLAPRALRDALGSDVRVALIDTDVVMTGQARCIFDQVPEGRIGVVSQERGLPFPVEPLRRRIALYRRSFVDPSFPLTSILNAKPRQLFEWAGLPAFDDYFCAGMLVLDTGTHAELFADWYRGAPRDERYEEIGAWEEVWLNACIQPRQDVVWLDYSWHALWIYEVAALYPFLYAPSSSDEVAAWCLASSLIRNDFVHLAGNWESALLRGSNAAFPDIDDLRPFVDEVRRADTRREEAVMRGKILPPQLPRA